LGVLDFGCSEVFRCIFDRHVRLLPAQISNL
jgi:hypothetical protein